MKVILSTGGTGGHIFPAIAVAEELRSRIQGVKILFVGAEGKMEMQKVPQAGFEIIGLPVRGLHSSFSFNNIKIAWLFIRSLVKAKNILKRFKPDVVMGFGAFASAPIMMMSKWTKAQRYIHEQNAFPGKVNLSLAKSLDGIFVAYEGMEKFFPKDKLRFVGNPIRKSEGQINRKEAFDHFELDQNCKLVLITGGSGGARTLNEAVLNCLDLITGNSEIQWLWQCGKAYHDNICENHPELPENLKLVPFIDKMSWAMDIADLVIARAGALTISELAYWEKAAVLIPSPNVAEDHQTKNARAMVKRDACGIIKDVDAKDSLIAYALSLISDQAKLGEWSYNIGQLKQMNTAEDIVNELINAKNK